MVYSNSINHLEDLVLLHLEIAIDSGPRKHSVLPVLVLMRSLCVVLRGEVGPRAIVEVAFVGNYDVPSHAEDGSVGAVLLDQASPVVGHHLLLQVQRQQEGCLLGVVDPGAIVRCPGVLGVSADGLFELCSDENEGIWYFITFLVKGRCAEAILRPPIKQSKLFGVAEALSQESQLPVLLFGLRTQNC